MNDEQAEPLGLILLGFIMIILLFVNFFDRDFFIAIQGMIAFALMLGGGVKLIIFKEYKENEKRKSKIRNSKTKK